MLRFFQKLEDLNLWDVHKESYDMEITGEIHTYTGITKKTSRIDYIWASENVFLEMIKAKIVDFE